ncbi:MAG TPA: patatin-like phospholipase family protein [Acidimicrobiales bacterium]|nr:patatin-like phospholipase family protein [Acidimicrobiales bacterium]
MSRALVFGGGGPVGIGWESGLIAGLRDAGVDITGADLVVGTSAGSVVGAALVAGRDPEEAAALAGNGGAAAPEASGDPVADAAGLEALMSTVAEAAGNPEAAERVRARLGALALSAATVPESQWLDLFDTFAGWPWPTGFACTAVDTATGQFRVWDETAGVPLQAAVASSCAVPAVFPPVTIDGARYMDGGVRDMLNADVAAGHDTVVVVSCTLLEIPAGLAPPAMEAVFAATRAQIDGLRNAGSLVEVVVPGAEMLEVSGWGMNLMDFSRAAAAFEAGRRQGAEEAARIGAAWA